MGYQPYLTHGKSDHPLGGAFLPFLYVGSPDDLASLADDLEVAAGGGEVTEGVASAVGVSMV